MTTTKAKTKRAARRPKARALVFRCSAEEREALKAAARAAGLSVQKMFERLTAAVLAERAAHARFQAYRAEARRRGPRALEILRRIERRQSEDPPAEFAAGDEVAGEVAAGRE